MKSTADIMVKSSGMKWKQIESHVDRTQPFYSNKNVDVHRSGSNMIGHLDDYKKLMTEQYTPYLKAYNAKCVKQRKKSRMYGQKLKSGKRYKKYHTPVEDYLRHSKRRNERMVVFYLGNKDIRKKYYSVLRGKYGLNTKQIRDMENKALVHTIYTWNELNPYLKVTDFATNTDESTAHVHTRMVTYGIYGKKRDMATKAEKKKNIHHYIKKPLMSFNRALTKTYPSAINAHGRVDSREAMRAMRKKFDPIILQSFNRELARNGYDIKLDFARTGRVNHYQLKEYQAHKDMQRAENRAQSMENKVNSLKSRAESLSSVKPKVIQRNVPIIQDKSMEMMFDTSSSSSSAEVSSASSSVSSATDMTNAELSQTALRNQELAEYQRVQDTVPKFSNPLYARLAQARYSNAIQAECIGYNKQNIECFGVPDNDESLMKRLEKPIVNGFKSGKKHIVNIWNSGKKAFKDKLGEALSLADLAYKLPFVDHLRVNHLKHDWTSIKKKFSNQFLPNAIPKATHHKDLASSATVSAQSSDPMASIRKNWYGSTKSENKSFNTTIVKGKAKAKSKAKHNKQTVDESHKKNIDEQQGKGRHRDDPDWQR